MENKLTYYKQANIKACGKEYLSDVLNYKDKMENINEKFCINYLTTIKNNTEEATQTLDHFRDLAQMLIYTFQMYNNNVKSFETEVLQINSIISSSLLVEQQIHDILYNKDLTLISSKETEAEKWQNTIDALENSIEQLEKQDVQIADTKNKELKEQLEEMLKRATQYYKDAEKQEQENKNKVAELKKDYYYIGSLSKDKGFYQFFIRSFTYIVFNDIIEKIREYYLKEYSVKLNKKSVQQTFYTKPCLDLFSFGKANRQLASVIDLNLLNSGKSLPKKALNYYNNLLYLSENKKKQTYLRAINRYSKDAIKELETLLNIKAPCIYDIVLDRTQRLLTELRWCDFEE